MTPFEYDQPQYETGAGPGANAAFPADVPLSAYTQYEILNAVVANLSPELAKTFDRARGESEDFGDHFSCIDDVAAPVVIKKPAAWSKLCEGLITNAREVHARSGRTRGVPTQTSRSAPRPRPVPRFNPKEEKLEEYLARVNEELKRQGKFSY